MQKTLLFTLVLFSVIAVHCLGESLKRTRVLVLLDNVVLNTTHSIFFEDLRANGYTVDIKLISAFNIKLKEYGEFLYDHIVVFCTSEPDPKLKAGTFLEFFDAGNNLLIAGDIDSTKQFRLLYNSLGVELDELGSQVYDHFNNADPYDNTLISTSNVIDAEVFSGKHDEPILYRGIGMTLSNYENYQVYGLLRAGEYAYAKKQDSENTLNVGNSIVLLAAAQGTNNARAILCGSVDMFSNELYHKSNDSNRRYINSLLDWNFGLKGILRVGRIYFHKINETEQHGEYKIYDEMEYNIDIEQYSHKLGAWVPYDAPDVTLEFVMMDPYVRLFLTKDSDKRSPRFYAQFQLPDKYGVFQFKTIYRKPGYTFLNEATKVTVRPFNHNEFERYLFQASPYYVGVFATILMFLVFFVYFLFDGEGKAKKD